MTTLLNTLPEKADPIRATAEPDRPALVDDGPPEADVIRAVNSPADGIPQADPLAKVSAQKPLAAEPDLPAPDGEADPAPVQPSFISLNELERMVHENPVNYLVEGLLPADDVHVAVGDSGLGKTPWAYQLGLCVAAGIPFLGHSTRQGRVLYYDLENGSAAVVDLGRGLCAYLGIQTFPEEFLVRNENASVQRLEEAVAQYKPSLVIIDTVRPFNPQAETKNDEMARFLNECRALARSTHCAILLLHHTRKPGADGVPNLEGVPTLEWLYEAAGARALINQTNTRMAFDIDPSAENPGSVLVFKSFVKIKGENGTMYLERVCNNDGEPIGYRRMTGVDLLRNDAQKDAYNKLPAEFTFREALSAYGKSDDPTRKWLLKCIGVGILDQPARRGSYRKTAAPAQPRGR